ncbi:hypothetical protein E2C01_009864 [Portunus trituberculatus]|uniref:Uncharacterized protein n=1 Tax=Portunus trituberculatus TaxID=210409 RepID=A0A5B7D6W1_PORTR|nr:hypothetical protein [Portunus trituberculatus]
MTRNGNKPKSEEGLATPKVPEDDNWHAPPMASHTPPPTPPPSCCPRCFHHPPHPYPDPPSPRLLPDTLQL